MTVYDFKTDRMDDTPEERTRVVARYERQLATYRKMAALLTGASLAQVGCALVLTAVRRRVELAPGADLPGPAKRSG